MELGPTRPGQRVSTTDLARLGNNLSLALLENRGIGDLMHRTPPLALCHALSDVDVTLGVSGRAQWQIDLGTRNALTALGEIGGYFRSNGGIDGRIVNTGVVAAAANLSLNRPGARPIVGEWAGAYFGLLGDTLKNYLFLNSALSKQQRGIKQVGPYADPTVWPQRESLREDCQDGELLSTVRSSAANATRILFPKYITTNERYRNHGLAQFCIEILSRIDSYALAASAVLALACLHVSSPASFLAAPLGAEGLAQIGITPKVMIANKQILTNLREGRFLRSLMTYNGGAGAIEAEKQLLSDMLIASLKADTNFLFKIPDMMLDHVRGITCLGHGEKKELQFIEDLCRAIVTESKDWRLDIVIVNVVRQLAGMALFAQGKFNDHSTNRLAEFLLPELKQAEEHSEFMKTAM